METNEVNKNYFMKVLKPREIVSELDKYIIGQDQAKRSVAIALQWMFFSAVFATIPRAGWRQSFCQGWDPTAPRRWQSFGRQTF